MNVYYQNWLEVVARIDQLHWYIFLIVLTVYWLYRWHGRQRVQFSWVTIVASLAVVTCLVEPALR